MNAMQASNASSALLSTLSESPSTQYNPYVYSEAANIQSPTSVNWEPIEHSSGTTTSTLHFPLSKNGLACRAVLALQVEVTAGTYHIASHIQNCINEITLSSQGRAIVTLNKAAIFAIASAAPSDVRAAYEEGAQLISGAVASNQDAGNPGKHFYSYFLDLPMYWSRYLKTSLLTTFNQNMEISVSFASYQGERSVYSVAGAAEIKNPKLFVQYRNQMEAVQQATVSENQDSGMLSMVIPTWSYEQAIQVEMGGTRSDAVLANNTSLKTPFTINIKDTSCVERIYVMAMIEPTYTWRTAATDGSAANGTDQPHTDAESAKLWGRPLELTDNLKFSSNGQTHFELPTKVLQVYGHPKQGGSSGFSGSQAAHTFSTDHENGLGYVYCIELSPDDGQDSDHISNLLSLRELSNPQISGVIKAFPQKAGGGNDENLPVYVGAKAQVTVRVAYSRRELASIVSSNGRYSVSLSN